MKKKLIKRVTITFDWQSNFRLDSPNIHHTTKIMKEIQATHPQKTRWNIDPEN